MRDKLRRWMFHGVETFSAPATRNGLIFIPSGLRQGQQPTSVHHDQLAWLERRIQTTTDLDVQ
jgi:hypothetical protein